MLARLTEIFNHMLSNLPQGSWDQVNISTKDSSTRWRWKLFIQRRQCLLTRSQIGTLSIRRRNNRAIRCSPRRNPQVSYFFVSVLSFEMSFRTGSVSIPLGLRSQQVYQGDGRKRNIYNTRQRPSQPEKAALLQDNRQKRWFTVTR